MGPWLVAEHDSFTSFEPLSFDAAGDKMFVEGLYGITATATGKHFESDWLHVYTIQNGQVTRWREYTETAAFAAANREALWNAAVLAKSEEARHRPGSSVWEHSQAVKYPGWRPTGRCPG
ncbi:MAG: hypothetical protein E5V49_15145 [Mesorhizobium sp.]|nr:hypothetical protein EN848_24760 [bacterium M00.F.Ca.ET.205.01.1.1]TGU49212.1 hypothetical protein EN795_26040 [bacterium M00.F.Ca.ET.152.01.1.1]TGV33091.1 hypothetical protein EN829_025590 [Mesorhizobium sp. M00.F.Ca.ET.186.01.1.1]TGZ40190.1 hypothetical protein EN805_25435 [bacterium M00.F.Ca.ET.162.01.1.1]TJW31760.1 MAG: hypothetical protein E5V49_15145 [Mesorhizobium sp.]